MPNGIIEKLTQHMQAFPEREADVVYALAQVRKILEYGEVGDFHTLQFFCDWALHTRLDRSVAQRMLKTLDGQFRHYDSKKPWAIDPGGKALEIFSFRLFWQQLAKFCEKHELPTVWVDYLNWKQVVKLYGEIVRDCPLVMTRKDYQFVYLKKFVLTACEPSQILVEANPGREHFGFNWEFTLSDGRTFNMPYTTTYSGDKTAQQV